MADDMAAVDADAVAVDAGAVAASSHTPSPIRIEDVWKEYIPFLAKRERYHKILEFIYFLRDDEEFQKTNAVHISGDIEARVYTKARNINTHIEFDAVKIQKHESGTYSLAFYTSDAEVADFDGRCMWVSAKHTYARLMNFEVSYPVFIKGRKH